MGKKAGTGQIATHLMNLSGKGKLKKGPPPLVIHATTDMFGGGQMTDNKYERKESARLAKEIESIRGHLKNLDPKYVVSQTKQSLRRELASKKARLAESQARLGHTRKSAKTLADEPDEVEEAIEE